MNTNYREIIGMPKLAPVLGVESLKTGLNVKQKKAVKNIKGCSHDQWGYVNGWYDERNEDYRKFMLDAQQLFDTIYSEALDNVYDDGSVWFGTGAESYLKDIRFCGKKFLETVTLYFTAKLLEEAVTEVEGTEEDAQRVAEDLLKIKKRIGL